MLKQAIAFIGGGNMARSLIGGLVADGWDPGGLRVADPDPGALQQIQERFSVYTTSANADAVKAAGVVVFAVKPQIFRQAAQGLTREIQAARPLVLSIAAGIRSREIERWLGGPSAVVRAMPNTPALVQSGATALFANRQVTEEQRDLAETILRAVGLALWIDDEELMDAVTALSGSGPAYFFMVMEALQDAAQELGLPPDTARLLTLQTAFGAAKMALESDEDAAHLRRRVTSPGGTTERAIAVLEKADLRRTFRDALDAARQRSRELADEFGGT